MSMSSKLLCLLFVVTISHVFAWSNNELSVGKINISFIEKKETPINNAPDMICENFFVNCDDYQGISASFQETNQLVEQRNPAVGCAAIVVVAGGIIGVVAIDHHLNPSDNHTSAQDHMNDIQEAYQIMQSAIHPQQPQQALNNFNGGPNGVRDNSSSGE